MAAWGGVTLSDVLATGSTLGLGGERRAVQVLRREQGRVGPSPAGRVQLGDGIGIGRHGGCDLHGAFSRPTSVTSVH